MSADSSTPVRLSGRYVLGERLAVGGMGEVHIATDERLARQVAVKLLGRGQGGSAEAVERFRREAVVVAGLLHPCIAQVYDYGVQEQGLGEQAHYIVMELADGADLSALLRRRGRLAPADVVTIATQVCAALAEAHRAGVVHRDIKPGNVIVSPTLGVKVTDFGIARTLGQSSITDVGTILGTAAYLSPEQARGEPATPASDLYSLGILVYQMLTGRPPFEGDTPVAVALRHLDEPVPAPSLAVPDLPEGLDTVVAIATAKHPADRYPDADVMAAALRAALIAPAHGTGRALDATRELPVTAAASAPPSRAASSAGMATSPPESRTRRDPQPRDRSRHPLNVGWVAAAVGALVLVVVGAVLLAGRPEAPRVASGPSAAPGPAQPTSGPSSASPIPTSAAATPTPERATAATPAGIEVPGGLVGSRAEDARRTLEVMGLEVQTVQVRSREAKGMVLATVPRPGRAIERGDTVVLVVSRGGKAGDGRQREEAFTVPGGIVGTPVDRVRDELPDDLRVTTVRVSSTRDEDTVVATWPGAGAAIPDGQLVLLISAGQDD